MVNDVKLEWEEIYQLLVPLISVNFLLVFLIYFIQVRQRILKQYPYYVCFLLAFMVFLSRQIVFLLPLEIHHGRFMLYRISALFTFGLPSLLALSCMQSGLSICCWHIIAMFTCGGIASWVYIGLIEFRGSILNCF